ncbi:hypothetical protein [Ligilactobacillus salivarius]|uniref:Uncharacterized protein n=1 Tax=Ligilactobacillus salivarius NIAS840 TaxID=1029822 RepID=F5VFS4_9LACO|nr:hypothetical protein [Ligilactobacillus salivarius]EGL98213.1 hypothetical protein NIAS840_01644 [Ligilactobacillus salivarius NIAS840]
MSSSEIKKIADETTKLLQDAGYNETLMVLRKDERTMMEGQLGSETAIKVITSLFEPLHEDVKILIVSLLLDNLGIHDLFDEDDDEDEDEY